MLFFHDELVGGLQGPAGPDGNPIGTVISYMGKTAPKDYLVCDGAAYQITDYPDLAAFFETQFGSKNHFGGDGETTFALPDMRNLFLRGWHGEAEEQLSGDVGAKQEATNHPNMTTFDTSYISSFSLGAVKNTDKFSLEAQNPSVYTNTSGINQSIIASSYYTSRPVNTAVLYCIKAVESIGYDANDYSLDEKRIGTWIDGKPLYREMIVVENTASVHIPYSNKNKKIISLFGVADCNNFVLDSSFVQTYGQDMVRIYYQKDTQDIHVELGSVYQTPATVWIQILYTKTTD